MAIKSLIINPGSTSTKLGVFEDETLLMDETLRHSTEEIAQYPNIIAQKDFRKNIILDFLKEKNIDVNSFDVIVGRGGIVKPIPGGTYEVTDALIKDLTEAKRGEHASNLGGIIAREIADSIGEAPLYKGSREGWILRIPSGSNNSSTRTGIITPNDASTPCASGFSRFSRQTSSKSSLRRA